MDDLLKEIENIKTTSASIISQCKTAQDIDTAYLNYFSKTHGSITELMKKIKDMDIDEKRKFGPILNNIQNEVKEMIEQRRKAVLTSEVNDPLIDLTIPQKPVSSGMLHPTTQIIREINEFFRYYGYSIVEGPEIETDEFNFRRLNLPEGHPATDLQDSLYIADGILLRTHTSSIEARVLSDYKPPIRAAFPGKSFRNETLNSTNGAFFHQYQGVVVDKGITIQHLKGTLEAFHKFLFGKDVELRFRYKYYPEVSPGMGVDMKCRFCIGNGCAVCKYRGWIEVLGSGMIHYNILKVSGIDPEIYTGFAFGMGLDRLVMQRFKIDDIRKLYQGGLVYQ